MKKLFTILVVLALLVFILAPGVTGYFVESAVKESELQQEMTTPSGSLHLVNSNFKRGWFSSDQSFELKLLDPVFVSIAQVLSGLELDPSQSPSLLVQTKAVHGVIPLASPGKGGLRPAVAQTQSDLFIVDAGGQQIALPLTVFSSVGTSQWVKLVAAPIERQFNSGAFAMADRLKWQGGEVEANVSDGIEFSGILGKANLTGGQVDISVEPVNLSGTFKTGRYSFPESTSTINVPAVELTTITGSSVGANNIDIKSDLTVEGDRVSATSNINTGRLTIPNLELDASSVRFSYDADAQAFSEFYSAMQAAKSSVTKGSKAGAVDPQRYQQILSTLVERGGRVAIDGIELELNGSIIRLAADLNVPAGNRTQDQALQNSRGSGKIVLPEKAISKLTNFSPQLAGGLAMATMAGFFEKQGNDYIAQVELANGVLSLNGLPIPIPF